MAVVTQYLKAIVAAVLAGLTALSAYLVNDTSLGDLTAGQWVQVAIAFFVTLGVVYAVPNASVVAPKATKATLTTTPKPK